MPNKPKIRPYFWVVLLIGVLWTHESRIGWVPGGQTRKLLKSRGSNRSFGHTPHWCNCHGTWLALLILIQATLALQGNLEFQWWMVQKPHLLLCITAGGEARTWDIFFPFWMSCCNFWRFAGGWLCRHRFLCLVSLWLSLYKALLWSFHPFRRMRFLAPLPLPILHCLWHGCGGYPNCHRQLVGKHPNILIPLCCEPVPHEAANFFRRPPGQTVEFNRNPKSFFHYRGLRGFTQNSKPFFVEVFWGVQQKSEIQNPFSSSKFFGMFNRNLKSCFH